MKVSPLYNQVLLSPILQGTKSKAGLLLPDVARNKSPFAFADVEAVGLGRINAEGKTIPLAVKAGDVVMYARNAGFDLPIEDERGERIMRLVEERYILGVVDGLARETQITGLDGRLLSMMPGSLAKADSSYANIEATEIAVREGWVDIAPDGSHDHHDNETPLEMP